MPSTIWIVGCLALLTLCSAHRIAKLKNVEEKENVTPYADYSVRLVDGPSITEGRFEMYVNGAWGTVCDTGFDDADAEVACYSLGFFQNEGTFLGNTYGGATGDIYFSDVQCTGTESVIDDCPHSALGDVGNCTHADDVSISCIGSGYQVRLVGGSVNYEGRLEISYQGQWGTVCDDYFDINDARVACYSLGHGRVGSRIPNAFGPGTGTGPILLDDMECLGDEENIGYCAHPPWGFSDCDHFEDVAISCYSLDAAVRLNGGASINEGRIEAYVNDQWGTVCDTGFGDTEAQVACLSLGFNEGQGTFLGNQFGPGIGPVYLDNVDCTGTESTLNECSHSDIGSTNCTHNDDVSISCVGTGYPSRLIDGLVPTEGRLEIFYKGEWGTVCNHGFTDAEAQVACYSLGYDRNVGRYTGKPTNVGSSRIWLDYVSCEGFENNIGNCAHEPWGSNYCTHDMDVAIDCSGSTGSMYSVRLIRADGTQAQSEGRLEYYYNDAWGTVCDSTFSNIDAQVACLSLGFNRYEGTFIGNQYGSGTGQLLLDNVRCIGDEIMIDDCPHDPWGVVSCDHTTDVSISCVGDWPAMKVRLANTDVVVPPTKGRLEINYYGTWGTVCSDGFGVEEAQVACASLGFGYVGTVIENIYYGHGTGMIWLDNVACSGDELSIGNCAHEPWGSSNCTHDMDVVIDCSTSTGIMYSVRLVEADGTPAQWEGRLEYYRDGVWGNVCDPTFSDMDAQVACYSLGYNRYDGYTLGASFGPGTGQLWLDNVRCRGDEVMIDDCLHGPWGVVSCDHTTDVGIGCYGPSPGNVRLVNTVNENINEGRLEIYYYETWGTVCDDDFGAEEVQVACFSLGYPAGTLVTNIYGEGNGTIWLDDVVCDGNEYSIGNCGHLPWEQHNCLHSEDVAINCFYP